MIRAVLDANVFVSAVVSPHGIPAQTITAWRSEQFQLLMSPTILQEIDRVLRYPRIAKRHHWSPEEINAFVDNLLHLSIVTPGTLQLSVIKDDPSDNRYLECAVEGEARYIVTGDQHLLQLEEYQGIEIVTPRVFVEMLGSEHSPA